MSFLDRVRQSASEAAFEAQRLVRVQRQQLALTNLRKERDGAALAVGNRAVELVREGSIQDEELHRLTGAVEDVEARIRETEAEIERLRTEQAPDARPADAEYEPVTGRTCPNCGTQVRGDAAYCTECGTPMSSETEDREVRIEDDHPNAAPPGPKPAPDQPEEMRRTAPEAPPQEDEGFETRLLTESEELMDGSEGAVAHSEPSTPVAPLNSPEREMGVGAESESSAPAEVRRCPNCGSPAGEGARFCTVCGSELDGGA